MAHCLRETAREATGANPEHSTEAEADFVGPSHHLLAAT